MSEVSRRQILAAAPAAAVAAAVPDFAGAQAARPFSPDRYRNAETAAQALHKQDVIKELAYYRKIASGDFTDTEFADEGKVELTSERICLQPKVEALRSVSPVVRDLMQRRLDAERRRTERIAWAVSALRLYKRKHPLLGHLIEDVIT